MKECTFIFIFSLLFLNSSCDHNQPANSLAINRDAREVLFFSDETDYDREAAYYDALIELKKQYPQEMDSMKVLSATTEKNYYDTFNIQKCPAIIVIYKDKIMVNINGNASKEQIIHSVTQAFAGEL
jgi:hypothetical protein